MRFRLEILKRARNNREYQRKLWILCSRDLLFYLNTFGYIYEPRTPSVEPFVTYPYQDDALMDIDAAMGRHDLCTKKSRDMGVTWMCLWIIQWRWQFNPTMQSFLLASRTERLVDKRGDSDSLFWKLEFMIKHQPGWMRPRFVRNELELINNRTGSIISGTSSTGDMARGGRRTAIFIDEFAAFSVPDGYKTLGATQPVTYSRIWTSTPQGVGNAYYEVAHDKNIKHLDFHWSVHPIKARGLYQYDEKTKNLIKMDKDYEYPKEFPFVLDGKMRSPWYDKECLRTPIAKLIAQELDMEFLGSGFQFFKKTILDSHEKEYVCDPYLVGEIMLDKETAHPLKFKESEKGHLLLWINVTPDGDPVQRRPYIIGCDTAAGTGASNSCLSIVDASTGERVGSYVNAYFQPHEMARIAAGLGWWFQDIDGKEAHIVPEANGGNNRQFIKSLLRLGYSNIYYRRNEAKEHGETTDVPGWASNRDNKRELLEEYGRALSVGDFINRDAFAIYECREYIYFPDGSIDHVKSRARSIDDDPSGARENHGDRVMADALAWLGTRTMKVEEESKEPVVPERSFKARQDARQKRRRRLREREW